MNQKECCLLEINVSENKRIVEIWLTNQVAVFMSGDNDLFDCTEGLIEHNLCL